MDFLISDIQEKEIGEPKAPSFPQLKSTTTGFPELKKRTKVSAFKQKRQVARPTEQKPTEPTTVPDSSISSSHNVEQATSSSKVSRPNEKQSIDRENNDRLASMSPEEIEAAQKELFGGLDSSVLEMLLKRANLDDPATHSKSPFDLPNPTSQNTIPTDANTKQDVPEIRIDDTSVQPNNSTSESKPAEQNQSKRVRWASVEDEEEESKPAPTTKTTPESHTTPNNTASNPPTNATVEAPPAPPKPHWPHPPQPEDLDPQDPNFLEKLHTKYFPQLPADPSKLAWMAPIPTPHSPADQDSPYYPGQDSLPVSALRFDFRGTLLPPRIARAVPATKGLHHHGEAPEAAGYTVRELARLCRSAVPGQRCVAYQTLGRILYRLGRGEWGGPGDAVAGGVWAEVQEGAVLRSLYEEAGGEEGTGHRSARAFAIEAIWLLEKGGWKDKVKKGK
ncbi:hypothetical protein GGS26DRAFT_512958 [Hypomontagnella submonticulosa]|nr:hypothetical protein GGS26DRAFT_512958 [Hypomontagnella submonticulosa]